jgi:hypothetical protein
LRAIILEPIDVKRESVQGFIFGGRMDVRDFLRLQRELLEVLLERVDFSGTDARRYLLDLTISRIVGSLRSEGYLVDHIFSSLPTPREFRAMRAGGGNGSELKRIMRRAMAPVVGSLLTASGDIEFNGFGGENEQ